MASRLHGDGTGATILRLRPDAPDPNATIVLAKQQAFRLGSVTVEPARCRLAHPDGRQEKLQPRIMQVLVALARAEGGIVTREMLTDSCWDGRIVGEDAISRAIARLRALAEGIGAGAFAIETVPKIGYRLSRGGDDRERPVAGQGQAELSRIGISPARALLALLCAAGLIAALALIVPLLRGGPARDAPTAARVAVSAQRQDAATQRLAAGIAADLAGLAGGRANDLAIVGTASANADYLVGVSGDRSNVQVTLLGQGTGELLWAADFAPAPDLRPQVASRIGAVLLCALRRDSRTAGSVDTVALRLFLTFCDDQTDGANALRLDLIRRVTRQAPNFAPGWANLAYLEAVLGTPQPDQEFSDDEGKRRLRAAARSDLAKARILDASLPEESVAQAALITEPRAWPERLAIIDRAISAAPDPTLYAARAEELMRVGRMREAVDSAQAAVRLDPLWPYRRNLLISALAYAGDLDAARQELIAAERIWPNAAAIRDVRFRFDLRYGDPANALRMMGDLRNYWFGPPSVLAGARAYLLARMDPTPANVAAAFRSAAAGDPAALGAQLQALAAFGRTDEAYRMTESRRAEAFLRGVTDILFRPHMRSLRNDRRFPLLAARLGLLGYWRASGKWPDFCAERDLPYDCRAEAARLGA